MRRCERHDHDLAGGIHLPVPAVHENAEKASLDVTDAAVGDLLDLFAKFSEHKIVVAPGTVMGTITTTFKDLPWDVGVQSILTEQKLGATEAPDGTITVIDCYRP